MSIKSVMPSSHLILCHPLLLLPPIPPSIRVLSSESTLRMRWPKYWSFSLSIIPSKEIPESLLFLKRSCQNRAGKPITYFCFSVLLYFQSFFYRVMGGCAVWHVGSQFPKQGVKTYTPTVEMLSLNHWTTREVLNFHILM